MAFVLFAVLLTSPNPSWCWYEGMFEASPEDLVKWSSKPSAILSSYAIQQTLLNHTFSSVTGGGPVSCVKGHCTICFCWSDGLKAHRCLTAWHVKSPKLNPDGEHCRDSLSVVVNENIFTVPVSKESSQVDILTFDVVDAGLEVQTLSLLEKEELFDIVGYVDPEPGDLVWKVGFITGLSFGKIAVAKNFRLRVEGMVAEEGDSGSAICLGTNTTHCIIVGMLQHGNSSTKIVEGITAAGLRQHAAFPLQQLDHPLAERNRFQQQLQAAQQAAMQLQQRLQVQQREMQLQQEKIQMQQEMVAIFRASHGRVS
jgi:hypothetical protein